MRTTSKHSGRIEQRSGLAYIASCRATWRAAWESACKADGIDVDSLIANFSRDNPFAPYVDRAYGEYCRAVNEYKAGGYVGLRIG